jgi:hypothetical protein
MRVEVLVDFRYLGGEVALLEQVLDPREKEALGYHIRLVYLQLV